MHVAVYQDACHKYVEKEDERPKRDEKYLRFWEGELPVRRLGTLAGVLEDVFEILNKVDDRCPASYRTRVPSLSSCDVVTLTKPDGSRESFFCAAYSWGRMPHLYEAQEEPLPWIVFPMPADRRGRLEDVAHEIGAELGRPVRFTTEYRGKPDVQVRTYCVDGHLYLKTVEGNGSVGAVDLFAPITDTDRWP